MNGSRLTNAELKNVVLTVAKSDMPNPKDGTLLGDAMSRLTTPPSAARSKRPLVTDPWVKKQARVLATGMGFDSLFAYRHKERCGIGTDYCEIDVSFCDRRYKFATSMNSMPDFGGAVYVGDIKQVEWVSAQWQNGHQVTDSGGLTAIKDNDPDINHLIQSGQIELLMRACHKTYFDRQDKLVKRLSKQKERGVYPQR
ncbi:MAG: hypothetical protein HEQ23_12750 [Tepidisphaera sp.]